MSDSEDDEAPLPDEAIVLPITEELDLHTFAPGDVPSVVADYLEECHARGMRLVRIVHGRGKGVQRAVVQNLLRTITYVESFADAPPQSGGWGATIVVLTPLR